MPSSVRISGGYLGRLVEGVYGRTLEYQWKVLNDEVEGAAKSHCVENFKIAAGEEQGEFYGMVFQDSDFAKWIEALAYKLMACPDPALERAADSVIDLMERAQLPDGYLNTYFICNGLSRRWTDLRDCHELYCAGHLLEGAIAYYQATGKRKMLDIMIRYMDYIDTVFGDAPGKLRGYPGHAEIELALCKLYDLTGEARYLKLAGFFLDQRGTEPYYFAEEQKKIEHEHFGNTVYGRAYAQSHLPVREQRTLEGHAVRGLYLACGMADVAMRTGDQALWSACEALFENIVTKRMYITGGVGSTYFGEAMTFDYDLPEDTAYAETCASIALMFFARRMLQGDLDGRYADAMERALYNTCLSGISLDYEHFFYVNPLTVYPEADEKDPCKRHVLPERQRWLGCACCPPNIARLICSLGEYQYTVREREIQVHLYLAGSADFELGCGNVHLQMETAYPEDGLVKLHVGPGDYALRLRIPGWCEKLSVLRGEREILPEVLKGYICIDGPFENEVITLKLEMKPKLYRANSRVRDAAGKAAVMRGPVVYCAEEVDNGSELHLLTLDRSTPLKAIYEEELLNGTVAIEASGWRNCFDKDELYFTDRAPKRGRTAIRLIPYSKWGNRGRNEMTVWLRCEN